MNKPLVDGTITTCIYYIIEPVCVCLLYKYAYAYYSAQCTAHIPRVYTYMGNPTHIVSYRTWRRELAVRASVCGRGRIAFKDRLLYYIIIRMGVG